MSSDDEEDDFFDEFAPLPRSLASEPPANAGSLGYSRLHVIFVVDLSKSMATCDLRDSQESRIDSVLKRVREFIAAQKGKMEASGDVYTVMTFNSDVYVLLRSVAGEKALASLSSMRLRPNGPTDYCKALMKLPEEIKQVQASPRVIFLSDGRPGDWTRQAVCWFQAWQKQHVDLEVHTIGFGKDVSDFEVLQQMAHLGGGGFQLASLNSSHLRKAFTSLSMSITATRLQTVDSTSNAPKSGASGNRRMRDLAFTTPWLEKQPVGKGLRISCVRESYRWNPATQDVQLESKVSTEVIRRKHPHTKGSLRYIFAMGESGFREKMVSKESLFQETDLKVELAFAKSSAAAFFYADKFVLDSGRSVRVLPCYLYTQTAARRASDAMDMFCGEPFLAGVFSKWVGNFGYINRDADSSVPECFAHYTHHMSRGELMVVDIQGVQQGDGFILTDPQLLSSDQRFGRADLGKEGMRRFLEEHRCNDLCRHLGIDVASVARSTISSVKPAIGYTHRFQQHYAALVAATITKDDLDIGFLLQNPRERVLQLLEVTPQQRVHTNALVHECIVAVLHPVLKPREVYEAGSFKRKTALEYDFDVDLAMQLNGFNHRFMNRYFTQIKRALVQHFSNMVKFDKRPTHRCLKMSIENKVEGALHIDLTITGDPSCDEFNNPSSYFQGYGSKEVDTKIIDIMQQYPSLRALILLCKHWRNQYQKRERARANCRAHIKSYYIELLCIKVMQEFGDQGLRAGFRAFLKLLVDGDVGVQNLNPYAKSLFNPHSAAIQPYRDHAKTTLRMFYHEGSVIDSNKAAALACVLKAAEARIAEEDDDGDFFDYY